MSFTSTRKQVPSTRTRAPRAAGASYASSVSRSTWPPSRSALSIESLPELGPRARQARLDGAELDIEDARDHLVLELLVLAEDDDGAVLGAEARDGASHRPADRRLLGLPVGTGRRLRLEPEHGRVAHAPPAHLLERE